MERRQLDATDSLDTARAHAKYHHEVYNQADEQNNCGHGQANYDENFFLFEFGEKFQKTFRICSVDPEQKGTHKNLIPLTILLYNDDKNRTRQIYSYNPAVFH